MDNQFEVQQKNQKSGKGLIVVVVILVLLVLGLGGYIVYDKMLTKESTETKDSEATEKNVEEKENLDEIANKLVEKLNKYDVDYYDSKGNVVFADLSDNDKMLGAYVYSNTYGSLKKTIVDDYFNNLFGVELSNYPDLNCWAGDGALFKYNSATGEYEAIGNHGHGGLASIKSVTMKYNKIDKVDGEYVITVTKVFGPTQGIDYESPENAFYADSKFTVKLDGLKQFTKTDSSGNWDTNIDKDAVKKYYDENYEQFKNIKPQYKYTFTKDNSDDYYLVKYEFVN